jgi:hypothetical protein
MQAKLKKLKEKLEAQEGKDFGDFKPTGNAILVFNYSRHKKNFTEDHFRSNRFADLVLPPGIHRQFDVLFRAYLAHSQSPIPLFVEQMQGSTAHLRWPAFVEGSVAQRKGSPEDQSCS